MRWIKLLLFFIVLLCSFLFLMNNPEQAQHAFTCISETVIEVGKID